jgi:hypothetical protein
MTNQGVSFHLPPRGQFSAAVDKCLWIGVSRGFRITSVDACR